MLLHWIALHCCHKQQVEIKKTPEFPARSQIVSHFRPPWSCWYIRLLFGTNLFFLCFANNQTQTSLLSCMALAAPEDVCFMKMKFPREITRFAFVSAQILRVPPATEYQQSEKPSRQVMLAATTPSERLWFSLCTVYIKKPITANIFKAH